MSLRLGSSRTMVFLCLFLVKDKVCHALDLQRYPDGVTAIDASDKCGASGIENDPFVLTKMTKLYGQEFWTGLGIFTQLTSWIEIIGCFLLQNRPTKVFHVSSVGLCEHECSTEYFGYSKENVVCSCFDSSDIELTRTTHLSSCKTANDEAVLVYKIYNGTIISYEAEKGLCSILNCIPPDLTVIHEEPCKANAMIQGVCGDGMRSSSGAFWGLTQNQTFENCWNQNKLLLNSSACQYSARSLASWAWTNVFREQIEVELTLGERTAIPKFCLSANISKSDIGEHVLTMHRHNCFTKLEWFACKKDSTTVRNEYHTDVVTYSNYGAVIGGILGACLLITVIAVLIVCKVRSKGLFTESNTHDYEDTSRVNFSTTTYEDLDNTKHKSETATSNRTCDINEAVAPVYEEVNKIDKP